jgi:hypothetical protein
MCREVLEGASLPSGYRVIRGRIEFQVEGEGGGLSTDNTEYTEGDGEGKSLNTKAQRPRRGRSAPSLLRPKSGYEGQKAALRGWWG